MHFFQAIIAFWAFERFGKIGNVEKPQPSGIFTMKMVLENRKRVFEKEIKMNIDNFLCKKATDCRFWQQKLQSWNCNLQFFDHENVVIIFTYKLLPNVWERVWGYLRGFYCF